MEERSTFLPPTTFKSQEDIILENCIEKEYKKIISSNVPRRQDKGWRRFIGLVFALTSGLCVSLVSLFLKSQMNSDSFDFQNIILWTFASTLTFSIPIVVFFLCHKKSVFRNICPCSPTRKEQRTTCMLLIVNGILYWVSIVLKFASLHYLSTSVASTEVSSYSGPLFVLILAHFCLAEKCGITLSLLSLLSQAGIVVFAWPQIADEALDKRIWVGIGLGIGSMLCHAISTVILRRVRRIHFSITILCLGCSGLILSLISFTITGEFSAPVGIHDLIVVCAVSASAFGSLFFLVLALKYEETVVVSIVICSEIIFFYVWQLIFLKGHFDILRVIGAATVLLCLSLVGFRKCILKLPKEDGLRKGCCFLQ